MMTHRILTDPRERKKMTQDRGAEIEAKSVAVERRRRAIGTRIRENRARNQRGSPRTGVTSQKIGVVVKIVELANHEIETDEDQRIVQKTEEISRRTGKEKERGIELKKRKSKGKSSANDLSNSK